MLRTKNKPLPKREKMCVCNLLVRFIFQCHLKVMSNIRVIYRHDGSAATMQQTILAVPNVRIYIPVYIYG